MQQEEEALRAMALISSTSGTIESRRSIKTNHEVWLFSVRSFAEEHDLLNHLDEDVAILRERRPTPR
eukprot:IDg19925t1